tara:strand:+ start:204 stop:587 length:384 start_codon:yes stop_codon:yes gene_type:complete
MNEKELQDIIEKNNSIFRIIIEGKIFDIEKVEVFQIDNPITEPTIRGGVYFTEMKDLKIQATILDMSISNHLSKAMLGPNKDFLDIVLEAKIQEGREILLISNLTNTMQNASKIVLYFTIKDVIINS